LQRNTRKNQKFKKNTNNFVAKNIKNAATPVVRHPGSKKTSSLLKLKTKQIDNFVNISTGNTKSGTPKNIISFTSENQIKKNKRVKSAFGNPCREIITDEKCNIEY